MPQVTRAGAVITVFDAYGIAFDVIDPLDRDASAGGDTNMIEAPMPGLVKAVFAEAGQAVQEGDRLAILEAMKMEHSLLAARDGVVAEVLAAAGDQVEAGAALVRLEEEE
jgi:3-methylcrotonyl-CoA carboxylase alpha subunit